MIGNAWSVKVLRNRLRPIAERPYERDAAQTSKTHPEQYNPHWHGGTIYNYGLEPPHYPVPSTIGPCDISPWDVILWYTTLRDGYAGLVLGADKQD